jgi:hypothetical protein
VEGDCELVVKLNSSSEAGGTGRMEGEVLGDNPEVTEGLDTTPTDSLSSAWWASTFF